MDVREKLEVIAHLGDHITYKEDVGICYDSALANVIEDAYMELKNGVTVQEWISVKDRLPEYGQLVIVYSGGVLSPQVFAQHFWREDFNDWVHITHWAYLPEPPKGECS